MPTSDSSGWPPESTSSGGAQPLRLTTAGAARVVTLDRPQQHNALNIEMQAALATAIPLIARDANIYAVILRSSQPGMFCSGRDDRERARLATTAPQQAFQAALADCQLIWRLECLSKPVVALLDGPVIGAGAGLTLVNTHRVAAAAYAFAVPAVQHGHAPDDGVCHVLARLPGEIGTYLALTGRAIGRTDALALGLVTHCIDAQHFDDIERRLADAQTVDPLLDGFHSASGTGALPVIQRHIDDCFAGSTVDEIMSQLTALADKPIGADGQLWAAEVATEMKCASPIALKVTLQHLRQSKAKDLRQVLATDYRLARCLVRHHDFQESVRARFDDANTTPHWLPAALADISQSNIGDLFRIEPTQELHLPTRQEMQAARA